jgi:beta-RFAP synthase
MIEVRSPSRLHFGLLAYHPHQPRQFGGVGLMIRRPDVLLRVTARPGQVGFTGEGRMADRALEYAARFAESARLAGLIEQMPGAHVQVAHVPRPHTGLGSGTQLGMAVGRALACLIDRPDLDVAAVAALVGRGKRSAIGAHGCFTGGLIIEGGKSQPQQLSPLVARLAFPESWRIVLIRPTELIGLAGQREVQAFAQMPPIPDALTDRMCRLVLLGIAPAVLERNLEAFGESLYELQQAAGECFQAVQGGIYADPMLEQVVRHVRELGVPGIGQSSWGPTLYAVTRDDQQAEDVSRAVQRRFSLEPGEILITRADNHGAVVRTNVPDPTPRG